MKNIFLSLLIVLPFIGTAQTAIQIDFEITQNGSQLLLDSVLVENQTTNSDTTIYYPNTSLEIDMLSGIDDVYGESNTLNVKQNYPNPFSELSYIEVFNPNKSVTVKVCDISGKVLYSDVIETEIGYSLFKFYPGADSQYVVGFQSGNQVKNIKLLHQGQSKGNCRIEYVGQIANLQMKSLKNTAFTFTEGDNLNFTSYTTACNSIETSIVNESPSDDATITFDYTSLTDIQPDAPEVDENIRTEESITFKWTVVSGAFGYKYNTVEDYSTAIELNTSTEFLIEELTAGTNHMLFVWAYNDCGVSFPLHIVESTTPLALTSVENDLITSGTGSDDFTLMYICQQPDSIILRTVSTNVALDEGNLELLISRMKSTVLGEGVGIAAPQIGVTRNVVWVQRYDKGTAAVKPWEVYINPVITAYSDTVALRSDGCLSVPGDCVSEYGIQGNSYRAIWIDVQYYDEDFNLVQERVTHQFTAHIFQHEIDHLNGVMYFDRQEEEVPGKYVIVEGESYEGLPEID